MTKTFLVSLRDEMVTVEATNYHHDGVMVHFERNGVSIRDRKRESTIVLSVPIVELRYIKEK